MDLKGKKVLITGGSDGLGLALARKLVDTGAAVTIISRSQDKLARAAKIIGSPLLQYKVCDVSDYGSVEKIIGEVEDIDILINNAGVWLEGKLTENPYEYIKRVIEINLLGLIYVTKAVLPKMIARNDGIILNVSSTSGLTGREGQSVYAASKWGVRGFTESLKLDLAKTNVKVFGFYPGGMRTGLFKKAGFEKDVNNWMDTSEVAEVLTALLKHEDSMIIDQLVLNRSKQS